MSAPVLADLQYIIPLLKLICEEFQIWSILGEKFNSWWVHPLCRKAPNFCRYMEGYFITRDSELDEFERFQTHMGHWPAGTSI